MSQVSDYVDLQVLITAAKPGIPNFGSLLLAANSTSGDAGLHSIGMTPTGLQEYEDVYSGAETDIAYAMLSAVVEQEIHVDRVKWYNTKSALTFSRTYTPLAPFTVGKVYSLSINGTELEYVVESGDDAADISTAFQILAAALAGVTAVDNTGSFSLTTTNAYVVAASPKQFTIAEGSSSAGDISTKLDEALAADPDFYGIMIDVGDDTSLADAAGWAETNKKLLFLRTVDADVLTGAGILDTLFDAGYHRTALIYSGDDSGRLDAASIGRFLATDPGQSDVMFKNHAGVTLDDLSQAQIDALKAKNGICYTSTYGSVFTDNGVAVSGRSLAVTRNVDWLDARIKQETLAVFTQNEIVLLSSEGITFVEKALRSVLQEAERKKVILPGWTVTVPREADLDQSAAIPTLSGFGFSATTGKGARKVQINGTLL